MKGNEEGKLLRREVWNGSEEGKLRMEVRIGRK
jgi:hypothetical protein